MATGRVGESGAWLADYLEAGLLANGEGRQQLVTDMGSSVVGGTRAKNLRGFLEARSERSANQRPVRP